ncbi:spindle and kinetochore-associated protein 3 isoform X2 [Myotis lucifugus]|uniref:spindle and kinetochore-associated protein 3 isoform X2 n=1 Tax=Myotis lucifugus TaxID=59463 RepID=UPI000CCC09B6|nr:spindle and kinetochore-associated protein 3 isoform X2 [Myotis lucifugus]
MAPARLRLPRERTSAPAAGPTKLPAPGIQASGGARGAGCSPWTRSGASVRSCGLWRSPWTAKRRGCSGRWRGKTAGNVNILLDKASLESQESIGFIKATKVLMKKTSVDIIKIRELFQKYGYNPRAKKNSEGEQEAIDSKPESTRDENLQKPDVKDDMSNPVVPSSSVSEKIPCSPQLSDFGLERYLISQIPPNPPQAVNNHKKERNMLTPSSKQSPVEVLKTPKCALNMDDFECVTPKLEHFGISEYTVCLNEDYTMGLKNVKNKSEEAVEIEPVSSNSTTASLVNQQLEKNDDEYTKSPLAPTFCTPGLKIPSTKNRTALVSTDYPLSKTNSSSNDLEMKDYTSLVLNSDKCFESCAEAPSSPVISSYENLLRTPTPPKILSKYNPNLATTPVAVKACHPAKHSLLDVKDGTSEMLATRKLVKVSMLPFQRKYMCHLRRTFEN